MSTDIVTIPALESAQRVRCDAELRQLVARVLVEEHGRKTRAAKRLRTTAPKLDRLIARLGLGHLANTERGRPRTKGES